MSTPTLESTIHVILELKRIRQERDATIATLEDSIKSVMGDEELLTAGAYKVSWKTFTSSRLHTTALKKAFPDIAAWYTKTTTARHFSIHATDIFAHLNLMHHLPNTVDARKSDLYDNKYKPFFVNPTILYAPDHDSGRVQCQSDCGTPC